MANNEMFSVSIITRREKLSELRDEFHDIGILGMTVTPVEGHGTQLGYEKQYRGVKETSHYFPKVLIEVVVSTVPVDQVIDSAVKVLRTGEIGDGKISVEKVNRVVRIRTGEENFDALSN